MKSSFQAESVAQITVADLNFCSMKRQGVLRLPPDGMPFHGRFPPPPPCAFPQASLLVFLYTPGGKEAL